MPSGLAVGASAPAPIDVAQSAEAPAAMPLAPSPALPFAQPRAEGKFDDVSTAPARPIPRASTDTTPLPPPPMGVVGSASGDAQVEHPRAPAEWIADRAGSRPARAPSATSRGKDPSAEEAAMLGSSARGGAIAPKKLLMIGGGVAVLALVLFIALGRGGSSSKPHARGATPAHGSAVAMTDTGGSAAQVDESGGPTATQPAHDRHGSPHGTIVASAGSAALATGPDEMLAGSAAAGSAEAGSDAGSAAVAPAPKHHPTLGGKQVVLEYDNAAHAPPTPAPAPREDSAAVEKARVAYSTGNQRLFAGDAAGAVRAYQQALDAYPGYVAGYRGLGLAYTQQGDKAKALQAFHTYLNNAPGAHDAALIKKRVTALAH